MRRRGTILVGLCLFVGAGARAEKAQPPSTAIENKLSDLERRVSQQQDAVQRARDAIEIELKAEANERIASANASNEKLSATKDAVRNDVFLWLGLAFAIVVPLVLAAGGFLGIKYIEYRVLKNIRAAVNKDVLATSERHLQFSLISIFCRLGYLYWRSSEEEKDPNTQKADALFAYRAMVAAREAVTEMGRTSPKLNRGERIQCYEAESQFLFHRLRLHRLGAQHLSPEDRLEVISRSHQLYQQIARDKELSPTQIADWNETYALVLRYVVPDLKAAEVIVSPIIARVLQTGDTEDLEYYKKEWKEVIDKLQGGGSSTPPASSEPPPPSAPPPASSPPPSAPVAS